MAGLSTPMAVKYPGFFISMASPILQAMKKTVLITGATSGIGKACAIKFAAAGDDVIITGRRNERLIELRSQLENDFSIRVLPLCFDVQDRKAVTSAFANLPAEWQQIDVLINTAVR
jgi:3-hydroxy acid dehydrogenase / malonic semialdehyde reductase